MSKLQPTSHDFLFENESSGKCMQKKLWSYYQRGFLVDATLKVQNETFRVHRNVLCTSSEYFETFFSGTFAESRADEITIRDLDGETFGHILQYIYTGQITIKFAYSAELLHAACLLNLSELTHACEEFLSNFLDEENVFTITCLADTYSLQNLRKKAAKYISGNATKLLQRPEFLDINITVLESILTDDMLVVADEKEVALGVLNWIQKHDPDAETTQRAMETVRLIDLEPVFIKTTILQHHVVKRNAKLCELLENVFLHLTCGTALDSNVKIFPTRRFTGAKVKLVLFSTSQGSTFYVIRNDVGNSSMLGTTKQLRFTFESIRSCTANNNLYVSGVGDNNKEIWMYKAKGQLWSRQAVLQHGRQNHVMTPGYAGTILIFGGSIEKFDHVLEIEQFNVQSEKLKTIGKLDMPTDKGVFYNGTIVSLPFWREENRPDEMLVQIYECATRTCHIHRITSVLSQVFPTNAYSHFQLYKNMAIIFTNEQYMVFAINKLLDALRNDEEITFESVDFHTGKNSYPLKDAPNIYLGTLGPHFYHVAEGVNAQNKSAKHIFRCLAEPVCYGAISEINWQSIGTTKTGPAGPVSVGIFQFEL